MKKRAYIFMLILFTVGLLSGCSKESSMEIDPYENNYDTVDTDAVQPDPVVDDADIAGGDVIQDSDIPALANRKIIYVANLTMDSPTPEDIYNDVIDNLDTYSAYIESANITSTKYSLKIRVLSENFTDFVEAIKITGDVVSFSKTSEDVTNSYSTFEARKLALETQHTRILELISVAVDLDDILTLEDARFEIEAELIQIGNSLANYDSLVDFSTINLLINKTSDEPVLLPKTVSPSGYTQEITKDSMQLVVYNNSVNNAVIYVDLLQNGEFIRQYESDVYGESTATFEINDLKSFTDYTFKITAISADSRESLVSTRHATTEKTFFDKVSNTFVVSFKALVSITEFLGLVVVAISPYAITGAILYFPSRILLRKYRVKHPRKIKVKVPVEQKRL